jgi:hypothetical protein
MPFCFNPEAKPFNPEVGDTDSRPAAAHKEDAAFQHPKRKQDRNFVLANEFDCSNGDGIRSRPPKWPSASRVPNGAPPPLRVHGGDEFPPLGAPYPAKFNKASHLPLPPRKSLLTEQLAALAVQENSKDGLGKVGSQPLPCAQSLCSSASPRDT